MTHKITHVKRRSGVQSGPDQGSLSEYGHNGSGTEGNRSVKAVQSILRHWGPSWDTNDTSIELQSRQKMGATEG